MTFNSGVKPSAKTSAKPKDNASPAAGDCYVWVWLPGAVAPVVAGRLEQHGTRLTFNYGRSYLARPDAMSLYLPELPLQPGRIEPLPGLSMASSLRDAAPDAWGRRVIHNTLGSRPDTALNELTYCLASGSNRSGALDFQASATHYVARESDTANMADMTHMANITSLATLQKAADAVQAGDPLPPALEAALLHGTSIGGARPKATLRADDGQWIAKFSSTTDTLPLVKAEFIAMRLAAAVGLNVAQVQLHAVLGRDVLLVRRFDRVPSHAGHTGHENSAGNPGWTRRAMVSALTLFGLDELMARYASYEQLATLIRQRFTQPTATLQELFGRIVFNILCGNTDDHARNHAAFWDGRQLTLTPAYDLCPQHRSGQQASQAMLIHDNVRDSRLQCCVDAAHHFHLSAEAATTLIQQQIDTIHRQWHPVCDDAGLGQADRATFWQRQFLNPYAFVGWGG